MVFDKIHWVIASFNGCFATAYCLCSLILNEHKTMPYNEKLAARISLALAGLPHVEEKKMFRGVTFMVNDKMCISVSGDNMMCRFDPALQDEVAENPHCKPMIMKGRKYKGYVYVSAAGYKSKKDFDYWVNLCLSFNSKAKSSKKKKK